MEAAMQTYEITLNEHDLNIVLQALQARSNELNHSRRYDDATQVDRALQDISTQTEEALPNPAFGPMLRYAAYVQTMLERVA
jgi:uncharacterized protein YpuA (DUF1002 family)